MTKPLWGGETSKAVDNFPALTPLAASDAGDPVVNVRTEYGYDVDGNLTGVLTPRAFQSGTVASPDPVWVQRFDYDQRGLPVRSHRAQDANQAGTCATTGVTSTAPARFGFGSTATCTSTTQFDDAGNPVQVDTPGGKTVAHSYNLDRLTVLTEATAPDWPFRVALTFDAGAWAYLPKTAAPEEIERAARLALIHGDIMAMPMGYDTVLSDAGASLSGGQRQRIALARALVHDPRILLLDEATSSLDAVIESGIYANLERLSCTRIVIAHRISTVARADLILVMENGRFVERGTHHELTALGGRYFELASSQDRQASAAAEESPSVVRPP